jgi:hypothetical protein
VSARSAGSDDVVCRAGATTRSCRSGDTAPVSGGRQKHRQPAAAVVPPATFRNGADRTFDDSGDTGSAAVGRAALSTALAQYGGQSAIVDLTLGSGLSERTLAARNAADSSSTRPGLIVLLVNAALPLLALLTLLALALQARRKRLARLAARPPRHRRKQALPTSATPRSR